MIEEKKTPLEHPDSSWLSRYDTVFSFLSLEVMSLGCFALGGALGVLIFGILGFFISLITISYLFQSYTLAEKKRYWISLIPFILLCLLLGLSRFFVTLGSGAIAGLVTGGAVSLGLFGFFLLGQGAKSISALKKDVILLCIGGTLALMTLIPGVYSLIRYGFFYAQRFKGMVYYYDGVVFSVASETKVLDGFSFLEASLSFGKFASFLLSLAIVPCFFISPRKETKRFLCFLAFGLLGLIDLAVVPFYLGLIVLVFVYLLSGIYRLVYWHVQKSGSQKKTDKALRICFFILIGLVAAGLLLLVVDAFTNSVFSSIPINAVRSSRSSGLLSRIAKAIRAVFVEDGDSGKKLNILGMLFGVDSSFVNDQMFTRVFEFSLLWQNGLIAFILFLFCVFFMIKESQRFLICGKERMDYKVALVVLLFGLFIYASLFNDELPYNHLSSNFASWSRRSYALLACFLGGLIYSHKKKETPNE